MQRWAWQGSAGLVAGLGSGLLAGSPGGEGVLNITVDPHHISGGVGHARHPSRIATAFAASILENCITNAGRRRSPSRLDPLNHSTTGPCESFRQPADPGGPFCAHLVVGWRHRAAG